jgi:hypothetical protein
MAEEEQEKPEGEGKASVENEGGAAEEEEEKPKFEYCEACGYRMMSDDAHGGGDPNNKWCIHCCEDDGTHKSREEVKKRVKELLQSHEAYTVMGEKPSSEEDADELAEAYMKKMKAWMTPEERKQLEEEDNS